MLQYDLVIVGGGLVGAGLAVALRDSNFKIALVDARLPSNEDPRLFALNAASCQFLANLNLWPELAFHASAIHQVHVSNQGHFGAVRLNREEMKLDALGHVIPARYIEAELNAALTTLPNCRIYRPARLQELNFLADKAELTIFCDQAEMKLQASLVIGADGTESTVRKLLNIKTDVFDYQQSAIVTRVRLKRSHQQIAYERFNPHGAIAMLPLRGEECASIWTADNKFISQCMEMPDDLFLNKLQQAFGYRLGRLQALEKRHVFPLRMLRAEKAVEKCVYLLGNSAHTLHPIAAQGFNLALYEVAVLAQGLKQKQDLQQIHAKTQKQQAATIGVSHRLSTMFGSNSKIFSLASQLGMMGFDLALPAKRKFMQVMAGKMGVYIQE